MLLKQNNMNKNSLKHKTISITSFLFVIVFATKIYGQTYLYEGFGSNTMPPQGWSLEAFPNQQNNPWGIDNFDQISDAGGTLPEARFLYFLSAMDTSRFISPIINMSGVSNAVLSFKYQFTWDANGPGIGVATRFGSGAWNVVWQENPTGNLGPMQQNISLSNIGQGNFQLCFFVSANLTSVGIWFIDEIKLHTPLSLDAKLSSIRLPKYVESGVPFELNSTVVNNGLSPINSFDVSYTVNGSAPQVQSFTGLNLELGDSSNFTLSTPIALSSIGSSEVRTYISNINGSQDLNSSNDTLSSTVWAVTFVPQKKVLAEEVTGTWCQFCVRGACYMDYMADTYPDTWIGVAIHNNDAMMNIPYNNAVSQIIPNWNGGYPSVTSDRTLGDDLPEDLEAGYLRRISIISPATIGIHNYSWNPISREVSFDVQSEFVADINSELRFGVIFVEDSLYGWAQSNYYSGGANGPMCGFENLPNPVPASLIHYDHVGREVLDSPYGTPGSLPLTIEEGDIISHHYTYTIPQAWNYDKLHVIGILIDATTGEILNATNTINNFLDIADFVHKNNVEIYPNPTNDRIEVKVNTNLIGSNYEVSDIQGIVMLSGEINSESFSVELGNLCSGTYLLNIMQNNNQIFKIIKK